MAKELVIIGSLANVEHGTEQNTLLEELNANVDGFYLYKQVFEPGVAYASMNWQGIISTTASIATIATLAWSIYTAKVKPAENNPQNKIQPWVMIQVKDSDGNFEMFRINGEYENKDIFIQEFTHKIEILRQGEAGESIKETMEKSKRWVRIEK